MCLKHRNVGIIKTGSNTIKPTYPTLKAEYRDAFTDLALEYSGITSDTLWIGGGVRLERGDLYAVRVLVMAPSTADLHEIKSHIPCEYVFVVDKTCFECL